MAPPLQMLSSDYHLETSPHEPYMLTGSRTGHGHSGNICGHDGMNSNIAENL